MYMSNRVIRRAGADDVVVLAARIDGFSAGHPAQGHSRSLERLEEAFFGKPILSYVLLAEKKTTPVGFGIWRKTYDLFWSMFGGEGIGLYVSPTRPGFGIAAAIVAAMCEDIRRAGGQFLQTTCSPHLAPLYKRVAVGAAERREIAARDRSQGYLTAL
jgi:hypothetical protein